MVLLATAAAEPADAMRLREAKQIEIVEARPVGPTLMAVVSLSKQRITIYDADGWTLRAPVSSGQPGYDTPAGIYSIIEKEEEHYSNRYDDAEMPFIGGRCPDTRPLTAVSGCHMNSPNVSST
jgi:lipoprotein-anchoring transpeptidase ErfK/SrfK